MRIFESVIHRKTFKPECDEVRGDWRKLHNQVLQYVHSSPNIIPVVNSIVMRWTLHVASVGKRRGACTILLGKPKGMETIRKLWRRRESNSKMDLKRIWMVLGIDCSVSGEGQAVGCYEHGNGLDGVHKIREFTGLAEELLASKEGFCPVTLVW